MMQNTDCVQHRRNLRLAIDNGQFPHLKVLSQSVVMYILKYKEDDFCCASCINLTMQATCSHLNVDLLQAPKPFLVRLSVMSCWRLDAH
jgi:hypothetical protein